MNELPTTFEECCTKLGIDPAKTVIDYSASGLPEEIVKGMIKHSRLLIITAAINHGQEGEPIYYPVFSKGSPSGVGFAFVDCGRWSAASDVGARLCFVRSELAEYAGKTFLEDYKQYHVPGYEAENVKELATK